MDVSTETNGVDSVVLTLGTRRIRALLSGHFSASDLCEGAGVDEHHFLVHCEPSSITQHDGAPYVSEAGIRDYVRKGRRGHKAIKHIARMAFPRLTAKMQEPSVIEALRQENERLRTKPPEAMRKSSCGRVVVEFSGDALYRMRVGKGLSRKALSKDIAVSHQAISRWERERHDPNAESLDALSDALGVSFYYARKADEWKCCTLMGQTRASLGISISSLASKVGASSFMVSHWERGMATPEARHLKKIEDILGVVFAEGENQTDLLSSAKPPSFADSKKNKAFAEKVYQLEWDAQTIAREMLVEADAVIAWLDGKDEVPSWANLMLDLVSGQDRKDLIDLRAKMVELAKERDDIRAKAQKDSDEMDGWLVKLKEIQDRAQKRNDELQRQLDNFAPLVKEVRESAKAETKRAEESVSKVRMIAASLKVENDALKKKNSEMESELSSLRGEHARAVAERDRLAYEFWNASAKTSGGNE